MAAVSIPDKLASQIKSTPRLGSVTSDKMQMLLARWEPGSSPITNNEEVGNVVGFETKVILKLLAEAIINAETLEEAYNAVAGAASVEGSVMPSYEEALKLRKEMREKSMIK